MTIAVSIKINDGIVLAADSAMAVINRDGKASNVYNNSTKIYKITRKLRTGITSWGAGRLKGKSIENIIHEFNYKLKSGELNFDLSTYTVKNIADLLKDFIYNNYYKTEPTDRIAIQSINQNCLFGCIVTGYDFDDSMKTYVIKIEGEKKVSIPTHDAISYGGEVEPIERLINGYSQLMHERLTKRMPEEQINGTNSLFNIVKKEVKNNFTDPGMPLQDAIDLARFLVKTAIGYRRFSCGSKTIGGHCDTAVITKNDGFTWISKKKLK